MFLNRSYQKELLDASEIPPSDLYQNLRELEFINTYLGGHTVTLQGIEYIYKSNPPAQGAEWHIVDVGSGGGDTLKQIALWGRRKNIPLRLTGVDLKQECITFAQQNCQDFEEINFIQSDYAQLHLLKADVITSALFCHHLNDEELTFFLGWLKKNASIGFIINDLHRHFLAYHSIKILTRLFSKSYLVKNDAPLSVLRGFDRKYLEDSLNKSGWDYRLYWKWAFRWLIIGLQD